MLCGKFLDLARIKKGLIKECNGVPSDKYQVLTKFINCFLVLYEMKKGELLKSLRAF